MAMLRFDPNTGKLSTVPVFDSDEEEEQTVNVQRSQSLQVSRSGRRSQATFREVTTVKDEGTTRTTITAKNVTSNDNFRAESSMMISFNETRSTSSNTPKPLGFLEDLFGERGDSPTLFGRSNELTWR